jgi:hypothetical protein
MLAEKIVKKLRENPEILDMTDFVQDDGTKFCLAGLILHVSGVKVISKYNPSPEEGEEEDVCSFSFSLHDVEDQWREYERKNMGLDSGAYARQLWAAEYGEESAKALPFYNINWNVFELEDVTADILIEKVPELKEALEKV